MISGGQLRGASRYTGLSHASLGCDTCEGKGYIEISRNDPESIDPYARKK